MLHLWLGPLSFFILHRQCKCNFQGKKALSPRVFRPMEEVWHLQMRESGVTDEGQVRSPFASSSKAEAVVQGEGKSSLARSSGHTLDR